MDSGGATGYHNLNERMHKYTPLYHPYSTSKVEKLFPDFQIKKPGPLSPGLKSMKKTIVKRWFSDRFV